MKFLKDKFNDSKNLIHNFLDHDKSLFRLESKFIDKATKVQFVQQFTTYLLKKEIINDQILNAAGSLNPWSIDFPSWYGSFDESVGKKIFIIGSEPHIHHKYLQTVYGFNNENEISYYVDEGNIAHPIFRFISQLISHKLNISLEDALKECYLTDLFPLSPFKGNGKSVGSSANIQKMIGDKEDWIKIRRKYADQNLPIEIENVKPELILTQGKAVFQEVVAILKINHKINEIPITPKRGSRRQFVRSVIWNNIQIISVPHIGSRRMRTFWNENLEQVKRVLTEIENIR